MAKRAMVLSLIAGLIVLPPFSRANAEEGTGTLVFDVESFKTEVDLKKKVQKQLAHAGVLWGVDGNQLVVTLVSPNYINADFPYLTRYGTSREIDLPDGTYRLTCVGYLHNSNSRDVDKVLSASAFFNMDILAFEIHTDKVTTLKVSPVVKKHSHSSFLLKIKTFMPELTVKVIENGSVLNEAVINHRTEQSVAWDDYSGPLKFEG